MSEINNAKEGIRKRRDEDILRHSWSALDLAKAEAKRLVDEGVYENEDEAFENTLGSQSFFDWEWQCLAENLKYTLQELENEEKPGLWYVERRNFGWRNLGGHAQLALDGKNDGQQFLSKILPETDCSFKIYEYEHGDQKGIKVHNFHHDSPTGEWYYAIPVKSEWFCVFCGEIFVNEPLKVTKLSLEFTDGERCCEECADIRGYELVDKDK